MKKDSYREISLFILLFLFLSVHLLSIYIYLLSIISISIYYLLPIIFKSSNISQLYLHKTFSLCVCIKFPFASSL